MNKLPEFHCWVMSSWQWLDWENATLALPNSVNMPGNVKSGAAKQILVESTSPDHWPQRWGGPAATWRWTTVQSLLPCFTHKLKTTTLSCMGGVLRLFPVNASQGLQSSIAQSIFCTAGLTKRVGGVASLGRHNWQEQGQRKKAWSEMDTHTHLPAQVCNRDRDSPGSCLSPIVGDAPPEAQGDPKAVVQSLSAVPCGEPKVRMARGAQG